MSFGGFVFGRAGRCGRTALVIAAMGCIGLALPAISSASTTVWGSSLSATPSMDTANGAARIYNDEPLNSWNGSTSDNAISSPVAADCPAREFGSTELQCTEWMHSGSDNTAWNTSVSGGSATASAGGQVLQVNIKGCAQKDPEAPLTSQASSGAVPVNTIEFQTLAPQGGGAYNSTATAGPFTLPFCDATPQGADIVSTYTPIHMCVAPGDTVSFYDLGGFAANPSGPSFYPQGVPFQVIAPVSGSSTESYTDADIANGSYAPGNTARSSQFPSGLGSEPGQEVMIQVVEGVGDDAYGQCPGGDAAEPANANTVQCVTRPTNVGDPYGTCNASDQPVFAPKASEPPTTSVSSNGTPVTGSPVQGNRVDMVHGAWSNSPYGYHEQWLECDSTGNNCSPIGGATNPYYYITGGDVGHTIEVAESALNDAQPSGTAAVNSPATQVVAGPNTPVITALKLNPSTWNAAGSAVITYQDSEPSTTTIQVLENGTAVKTLSNKDNAAKFCNGCSNGVKLSGLPAGSYQLQLTPTNGGTVGAPATLNFVVTSATPVLTGLHVNPDSFNSAKGATITYTDSQGGYTTLRVLQCQAGPGKKRKKKKKKHGTQKTTNACSKTIKTLHHNDRAGNNGVKLSGVPAGHYQLQIVSSYSGYKGTPIEVPFTAKLVRGKRHQVRAASDQLASALVIA